VIEASRVGSGKFKQCAVAYRVTNSMWIAMRKLLRLTRDRSILKHRLDVGNANWVVSRSLKFPKPVSAGRQQHVAGAGLCNLDCG
jgi:hypothetical protein